MNTASDRLTEIRQIWKEHHWLYGFVGFLLGLLAFPLLNLIMTDALVLLGDFIPEAVGIIFTVLIIDRLYQRREAVRKMEELKARLLREARSTVNDVAVQAINEIREHGWLTGEDGLLKGGDLSGANLKSADLGGANLKGANLGFVDLQGARLFHAHLENSDLVGAILQGADLSYAHLQYADLDEANLQNAKLEYSNFQTAYLRKAKMGGCDLYSANIQDANLIGVELDENTMLPDGYMWSPDLSEENLRQSFQCVFISSTEAITSTDAFKKWKDWLQKFEKRYMRG